MYKVFLGVLIGLTALAVLALGFSLLSLRVVQSPRPQKVCHVVAAAVGIAAILALLGVAIWFVPIREESKKYNLTVIEVADVPAPQEATEEGFVQLSDVNMHYVKYGTHGHDVLLIHGNGGSADSLSCLARLLANDYTVYCVSDRCQGKSSDPGVITYELMAKDVNEFIQAKGLNKPYVLGHSDGGMVGIALAANYPDSIGCLISCGSNSNPSAFKWTFTFGVQWNNIHKPDKLNNLMLTEPNFTPEYLSRITVPTYVVAGEFDIMPLSDTVYIHNNIAGSRIAIMKYGDHSSYFGDNQEAIYCFAKAYFEEIAER